jgi:hypothetical protein
VAPPSPKHVIDYRLDGAFGGRSSGQGQLVPEQVGGQRGDPRLDAGAAAVPVAVLITTT